MGEDAADIWLFSYGTLRQKNVQLATFGRELEGRQDALVGFARSMIAITDPEVVATSGETYHPIVARTGDPADEVDGMVFRITAAELAAADLRGFGLQADRGHAEIRQKGLRLYPRRRRVIAMAQAESCRLSSNRRTRMASTAA